MVVASRPDRSQIAVLEEGDLVEHYVAHAEDRSIVSSIYLGRVQNVLPGMEAAFVDIGTGRNAVLYAGEVGYDEEVEGPRPRIESMLRSGQPVLVQVTKDPMRHKGARLTTEISLAGRYLVFIPERESLGVSRRLPDEESERLRLIASRIRPEGHGLIVRTAAEGAGEDELQRDVDSLLALWQDIHDRAQTVKAPTLLYTEPELVIRVVRDLMNADIEKVVVDDAAVLRRIKEYIADVTPDLADRIELYEGERPPFDHYKINEQIQRAIERKVSLPSGGSIVIDRTEAMTVVDVNTGRFVGRSNLEETVLRTNLEAAEEVAKQLRLRDIGGIIVIDFIDMDRRTDRVRVMDALEGALSHDRARTRIVNLSPLGLVEMTRRREGRSLSQMLHRACPTCKGTGHIKSPATVAMETRRMIRRIARGNESGHLLVTLAPESAALLVGPDGESVAALERELERRLFVRVDTSAHLESVRVQLVAPDTSPPPPVAPAQSVAVATRGATFPDSARIFGVYGNMLVQLPEEFDQQADSVNVLVREVNRWFIS
jgi:ribonuclease E